MFKKTLIALAISGFSYPIGYCYINDTRPWISEGGNVANGFTGVIAPDWDI